MSDKQLLNTGKNGQMITTVFWNSVFFLFGNSFFRSKFEVTEFTSDLIQRARNKASTTFDLTQGQKLETLQLYKFKREKCTSVTFYIGDFNIVCRYGTCRPIPYMVPNMFRSTRISQWLSTLALAYLDVTARFDHIYQMESNGTRIKQRVSSCPRFEEAQIQTKILVLIRIYRNKDDKK